MKYRQLFASALVAGLMLAVPMSAGVGVLTGDTYVNSSNAGANFGAAAVLNVGNGSQALLQFDLSGTFPATVVQNSVTSDTTIGRATLKIFVNKALTAGTVTVAPLLSTWSEGTVTYGSSPLAGSGVTSGTISAGNQFVTVDVTSIVQGWVKDQSTNFGFLITSSGGVFVLDSKEASGTSHQAELNIDLDNGYRGVLRKDLTLSTPGFTSLMSIILSGTNTAGGRIWYMVRATDGGSQIATEEGVIQFLATANSITCTVQTTDKLHLGTVNSGCTPGFFNPGAHPGVSVYDNVTFSSPAPIVIHEVFFKIDNLSGATIRLEP